MTDFDAPLLLPHIEDVLVELSTQYLNMFRQKDAKLYFLKPRDYAVNFHIWLSTLLAFHQSVSFYTNF